MTNRFLVDNSVWSRMTKPPVRNAVSPMADRGLLAICGVVEMEVLYSARNVQNRDSIRDMLRGFEWLASNDDVWQRAIDVQCAIIAQGNHRAISVPDLI